jgi:hypothetical protein
MAVIVVNVAGRRRAGEQLRVVSAPAGDQAHAMLVEQADRYDRARAAVVDQLRRVKGLTCDEVRQRQAFTTEEAVSADLTVTMSVRQAIALVRVTGPVGDLNGSGPTARLLCAMQIAVRHICRSPERWGTGVLGALLVLQAALNDCLAYCRAEHDLAAARYERKRRRNGL